MKRALSISLLVIVALAMGCHTPTERAYLANTTFAAALTSANALHDQHKISETYYRAIHEAAEIARPAIEELNRVAQAYDAAIKSGANPAEITAIRFNGERVWSEVEPKLLALASKLLAARAPPAEVGMVWPRARSGLAA